MKIKNNILNSSKQLGLALLLLTLAFFTSCEDAYEIGPDDEITESNAITNLTEFTDGVIGVYAVIPGNSAITWNSWFADEVQLPESNNGSGVQVHTWSINTSEDTSAGIYSGYATVINRANRILEAGNSIAISTDEQAEFDKLRGELYAIRAWAHFKQMVYFSSSYTDESALAVPYLDYSVVLEQPARNTVGEVFAGIEADLTLAKDLIPTTFTENIFFTLDAVTALEARMALYRQDYPTAIAKSTLLIDSYTLTDDSNYTNMWNDNEDSEIIFKLAREVGGSAIGQFYTTVSGSLDWISSDKLYNSYDANDIRLGLIGATNRSINKYPGVAAQTGLNDLKEFRVAEQYLIRAEAYAQSTQLGLAAADYNALRTTRISSYTDESFTNVTDAMSKILDERFRELAFEGHRFLDLKRTGTDLVRDNSDCSILAADACSMLNSNYLFTLPIPQDEIFANSNMIQNDGY
ncbi:RagB/SusD family nutrient uptake outer membrane protein [Winogradskyella undariae]|uniref:RagB/SusD family nutrient uptake outer membrane protein n=1 Tax=Winogradskyella undariae TaxID=1285465 RepID=UPI00156B381B|nr:RagB/SusD family nutrient uptake outer membrane protein [Winogradskyella undariae]NRR90393.1 RagB/SusD family nutrient uptake outer membrane protein [Winogradskyella undariae]